MPIPWASPPNFDFPTNPGGAFNPGRVALRPPTPAEQMAMQRAQLGLAGMSSTGGAASLDAAGIRQYTQPPPPQLGAAPVRGSQPSETPQPWMQQWRKYLQEQAAYQQQIAQQLHGLGPYANNLTDLQQRVAAHRNEVMQQMLGMGAGAFGKPGP